jgi:hypothetical protein
VIEVGAQQAKLREKAHVRSRPCKMDTGAQEGGQVVEGAGVGSVSCQLGVQQAQLIFKMAMCARSRLCCVPGKGRMGTLVSF